MTIEEKYGIHYINGKRYYEEDMTNPLPSLDDCVPYLFRYEDIEVCCSTWNNMVLRVLTIFDERNPKSKEELLAIRYPWSKQSAFAAEHRTNHTPFKDVYLNTNHTSTHSMMSLQTILKEYGVDLASCYFLIRRHYNVEPEDAKEVFRQRTLRRFEKSLRFKRYSDSSIETILKNISHVCSFLADMKGAYNDLLLFDDYYLFTAFKAKALEKAQSKWYANPGNYEIFEKTLDYIDDYYKNSAFFAKVRVRALPIGLVDSLRKEIDFLFENLKTKAIIIDKLFARMTLLHKDLMKELDDMNNPSDVYQIAKCRLRKFYYFQEPFIAKEKGLALSNDELIVAHAYSKDSFTIQQLNEFADKMHLNRFSNYLAFIVSIASDYIQVSANQLVKKDLLDIDEEKVALIKKELDFYLESFGRIDSRAYKGYTSLPDIGYGWNKYILIGIIRCFFSDAYAIEMIGNHYDSFDYILDLHK